jgi:hypothetical protein
MASLGFGAPENGVTMRNAVFRLVLARAAATLDDPADLEELEVAEAFGAISFDLLEPDQGRRIGTAIRHGLLRLRQDVSVGVDLEEPVLPGIQEKLDELMVSSTHIWATERQVGARLTRICRRRFGQVNRKCSAGVPSP